RHRRRPGASPAGAPARLAGARADGRLRHGPRAGRSCAPEHHRRLRLVSQPPGDARSARRSPALRMTMVPSHSAEPVQILIVDDDEAVRASLTLLLKQGGYRSHAVSGPEAALVWLADHSCQLVLQDMNFSRRTSGDE